MLNGLFINFTGAKPHILWDLLIK